jgi:hypothetical protein
MYIQDERGRIEYAREEGIKQGKIETAKELLKMAIKIEKIAKATGLKKEEIEKLKDLLLSLYLSLFYLSSPFFSISLSYQLPPTHHQISKFSSKFFLSLYRCIVLAPLGIGIFFSITGPNIRWKQVPGKCQVRGILIYANLFC